MSLKIINSIFYITYHNNNDEFQFNLLFNQMKMYKHCMGIYVSDFSASNSIKVEATIVSIVLDENDKISDISVDAIENRIPIIDGSIAAADRTTIFKTR